MARRPLLLASLSLLALLTACQALPAPAPVALPAAAPQAPRTFALPPLTGRVDWPEAQRKLMATSATIQNLATVSLIDVTTGATVSTGKTDASGNFTILDDNVNPTFNPASGSLYVLEAMKGLARGTASPPNAAGAVAARMRTVVRYDGAAAWSSICQSGTISYINVDTTAVAISLGVRYRTNTAYVNALGKVTTAGDFTAFTELDTLEQSHLEALVNKALTADEDPVAAVRFCHGMFMYTASQQPIPNLTNVIAESGAQLSAPGDITFSIDATASNSVLYVANSGFNNVLSYTLSPIPRPTAAFGTIAFGTGAAPATAPVLAPATPSGPRSLVADGAGGLWIADLNNNRIFKLTIATGAVTTPVACTLPRGITFNAQDSLYLAEVAAGVGRIRRYDISAGTFTNIVTTGLSTTVSTILHDGGNPGNLYVCDAGNDLVKLVNLSTNAVTNVVGGGATISDAVGTSIRLDGPQGMAYDGLRYLYISNAAATTSGRDIKQVDTLASNYTRRFAGNGATGTTTGYPGTSRTASPQGLAFDSYNNALINVDSSGNSFKIIR